MTSMRRWIRRTSPRSFSLSGNWPGRKLKKLLKVEQELIKVILIQMMKQ
jgi:hypothetical protein